MKFFLSSKRRIHYRYGHKNTQQNRHIVAICSVIFLSIGIASLNLLHSQAERLPIIHKAWHYIYDRGSKQDRDNSCGQHSNNDKCKNHGNHTSSNTDQPSPGSDTPGLTSTPQQSAPTTGDSPVVHTYPLHSNITTTIFWAGEEADASNGYISNAPSAWDEQWVTHFGGVDSYSNRNGYWPAGFTPKENPFYFALPYSDFTNSGTRKSTAGSCLNSTNPALASYSWCKNTWIAIHHNGKTAYAQWEDVGPYEEDDVAYVFGTAAPKNSRGAKAGLDVSPAVRDYLGLGDVDRADWQFVGVGNVPTGPWTQIITTNKGYSN